MSSDIPDWLRDLAPDASDDEPHADYDTESAEDTPEQVYADPMDDLRRGMDQADVEIAEEEVKRAQARPVRVGGMFPWQVMVLSILLFFNIAIIGFLFLMVLGRFDFSALLLLL